MNLINAVSKAYLVKKLKFLMEMLFLYKFPKSFVYFGNKQRLWGKGKTCPTNSSLFLPILGHPNPRPLKQFKLFESWWWYFRGRRKRGSETSCEVGLIWDKLDNTPKNGYSAGHASVNPPQSISSTTTTRWRLCGSNSYNQFPEAVNSFQMPQD